MATEREDLRRAPPPQPGAPVRPSDVPTSELVDQLVGKMTRLARKEVEYAKAELRDSLRAELPAAKGLGVAGLCALVSLNLVFVSLALLLASWMAPWGAALVIAAAVTAVGTAVGVRAWKRRRPAPGEAQSGSPPDDVRWDKERRRA